VVNRGPYGARIAYGPDIKKGVPERSLFQDFYGGKSDSDFFRETRKHSGFFKNFFQKKFPDFFQKK